MTVPCLGRRALAALAGAFALTVFGAAATAAPEAHILRIDPRASSVDGAPILTTVLEVVQNKRMSDQTRQCAALPGDANLDCISAALEQPGALYSSFAFPDKNAILTVTVDGADMLARFDSKTRWGESQNQSGVGTAWLILVDAASTMGTRFDEAKGVATQFVNAMGPQDIVDVAFFNDKGVVEDSHWVAQKQQALQTIAAVPRVYPSQGRTRPLFTIIKNAATDGFKDLGNAGQTVTVPMHQAMVVLSNGSAGADPTSNAAASNLLKDYLTKGRFPENNEVLPKTPVPVVSIWFPSKLIEEFAANAREFMEGLANTEIGGFYNIVRDGQANRAAGIVNSVRTRFNQMHIVKWRVACVAPTITQTFKLVFSNTNPPIAGDATFQNVPVGIDPTTWPLDIDREATERAAKKNPIYPGGTVKIYGNFCWGGESNRAEIYMVPKNQAPPASISQSNIEDAKKSQRNLIEQGMRGRVVSASEGAVDFELPSTDKFLYGKGEKTLARMIVYDNKARRTSAITADKIITLKAQEAPLNFILIGGLTFGGVVIVLLVVSIFRGGGRRRAPAPRPVMPVAPLAAAPYAATPQPAMGMMGPSMPAPDYGAPPPGPMTGAVSAVAPPPSGAGRAVLSGVPGVFTVEPGREIKAGRDGAICAILLTEPRVSGQHASLKVEGGQFFVRDENSNNGTFVNGQRLGAGVWTPVPAGSALRFGPVEFSVRIE